MLRGWQIAGLVCLVTTALLGAPAQARQALSSTLARSVLLVIADDHGLDALGAYGNPVVKTPHLDRLSAEGVRFTRAYATTASCSPSRSVLLTGLHTHTSGQYGLAHAVHNQHTFESVRSLPALLRGSHRTGIIGKDHVKPEAVYPFEVRETSGFEGNRHVAAMADRGRAFFGADARPFFLVVGFSDPHRAGNPQNGWKGFANDQEYAGIRPIRYAPGDVKVPAWLPDAPEVRQELAEYYEAISRLDQGVGLVLRALEESGRAGETLVIYLSDNGPPFPGAKTTLYACLRLRWRQENDFKYLREHYAVDQIIQYGADEEKQDRLVLNPRRKAVKEEVRVLTLQVQTLEAELGRAFNDNDESHRPTARGIKIAHGRLRREIAQKRQALTRLENRLQRTPSQISAEKAGRTRSILREDRRLVVNALKIAACNAEKLLVRRFDQAYEQPKDAFSVFRSLLQLPGTLEPRPLATSMSTYSVPTPRRSRVRSKSS